LPGINREVAALIVAVLAAPVIFAALAWRYIQRGLSLYFRNLPVYLIASVGVFVVASLANVVQRTIAGTTLGSNLVDWSEEPSFVQWTMGIGLGGFQQLVLTLILAPPIIQATYLLTQHDRRGWRESIRTAITRLPDLFITVLVTAGIVIALTLSIVLIPVALYLGVRWLFVAQAVIIDGANAWNARQRSSAIVSGHWLRSLGIGLLITFLTGLVGPLVAMLLLVLTSVSLNTAGLISGVIYSVAYPVTIMAATLFYLGRRGDASRPAPSDTDPVVGPASTVMTPA
jgi:hypothetical protein